MNESRSQHAAQGHGRARTMALQISKASAIRSSGVFVRLKRSTLRFKFFVCLALLLLPLAGAMDPADPVLLSTAEATTAAMI